MTNKLFNVSGKDEVKLNIENLYDENETLEKSTKILNNSIKLCENHEKLRPSKILEFIAILHHSTFYTVFGVCIFAWQKSLWVILPLTLINAFIWSVGTIFNQWDKDHRTYRDLVMVNRKIQELVQKRDNS